MTVWGSGTGVPASTAGIGVGVAVKGMDVGNETKVGTAVAGVGAHATNKNANNRRKLTYFFILDPFPMLNELYELESAIFPDPILYC